MKRGIFGGSFNPVHAYHVKICEIVLKQGLCDRLMVIPVAAPPHKQTDSFLSDEERLALLRVALAELPRTEVSDIEIRRGGRSYTSDTITELRKLYPSDKLLLIMGADMFMTLGEWHEYRKLIEQCGFIIFRRGDVTKEEMTAYGISLGILPENMSFARARESAVSSTELRKRLRTGKPINELVPKSIEKKLIMKENQLD